MDCISADENGGCSGGCGEEDLIAAVEDVEEVNDGLYEVRLPGAADAPNVHEELLTSEADVLRRPNNAKTVVSKPA